MEWQLVGEYLRLWDGVLLMLPISDTTYMIAFFFSFPNF